MNIHHLGKISPVGKRKCPHTTSYCVAPSTRASEHALSEHALSEHALSEHALSEHALSEHALSEHALSEQGTPKTTTINDHSAPPVLTQVDAERNRSYRQSGLHKGEPKTGKAKGHYPLGLLFTGSLRKG